MKKAFTLAEVLITLMIIGIVAALTIPSVISNYQQQEYKTGLKKAVSVLNDAIQTNIASDGETPYETSNIYTYIQKHMNVIKTLHSYSSNRIFYTADGMRFEFPFANYLGENVKTYENGWDFSYSGNYYSATNCGSYGLKNITNTILLLV